MSDPNTTLYAAGTADPRARAAQPQERPRGRPAMRAGPTSDVTRFRGVLAAAIVGAATASIAAVMFAPASHGGAPGPLSRPHERAKVACTSCHTDGPTGTAPASSPAAAASRACTSCHGAHRSTRRGHERALTAGAMSCATCHPIHRADQGVSFSSGAAPIRFAPGVETIVSTISYRAARPTTVAIATAASCSGCHDVTSPRDPIARCFLESQRALGDARPVVCFDEHQPALPRDGASVPAASGVCAGQHTLDRAIAWEAAREVAAVMPVVARPALARHGWLAAFGGLGAAALALAGIRAADGLRACRHARAADAKQRALPALAARARLPQIDTSTCLGCYACVDACPYDVLEVERYVAVVARPDACCGLTLCEQRCPNGSLRITDGEPIGDRPRLGDDLASLDVPGLYLAGDVTGLPLIKNAIQQGAHAASLIAADLERRSPATKRGDRERADVLDLIIIGAGPAGISAALRAKELGLAFMVIEQGSVAQSIRSFPRGKLVFDQPIELPVAGKLWLKESTKEELLSHWLRIVRTEKLPIREETRMRRIEREPAGSFRVTTEPREGGVPTFLRARRVLLAIGQRGSPRRLPFELAPDVEAFVHYHLADARSFEGQRVVVVGLGDVAMEAAIALSRQLGTTVTVAYRGDGFSRGSARNIAEVRRLDVAGRISVRFHTEVVAIASDHVTLQGPTGEVSLPYDAVLVLIGSIPPWAALRDAGVRAVADGARSDRSAAPHVERAP